MGIKYKMTEPPIHLKNIVNNFFRLQGDSKTYNLYHFADFNAKLLFIKSGKIGFCNSNNLEKNCIHKGRVIRTKNEVPLFEYHIVLLGPCQNYCLIKLEGEIDIVGVEMQTTGAWTLLADNVDKYSDTITEITDNNISGITQLADYVFSATDNQYIYTAISMFFSSKNIVSQKDQDNIEKIIKFINNQNLNDNIQDIATNIGTTSKQLLRLSKKYIGIAPMLFLHIARFKKVLRAISDSKKRGIVTDIAEMESFYDISHLAKETRSLSGHTPSELMETGETITQIDNLAIVFEDDQECTFCIYSY